MMKAILYLVSAVYLLSGCASQKFYKTYIDEEIKNAATLIKKGQMQWTVVQRDTTYLIITDINKRPWE